MTNDPNRTDERAAWAAPSDHGVGHGHRDLALGLIILGACALLYYETTTFPRVPPSLSQNVPAHFFPRLLIFTVGILTILMIVQGWRKPAMRTLSIRPITALTALLATVGIVLIPWIGVLAAVGLLSAALPLLWGERRLGTVAAYAVLLPASLYVLFTVVMQVRFPTGMLPF